MPEDRATGIGVLATLAEPTRRRLYEHVAGSTEPVGRDDAAAALGIPRTTAAFHLDRLAAAGLLEVVSRRRSGRTGPGAGRPAKLYRRPATTVSVSLPDRRYDLAAELLAGAVEEADRSGARPGEVLDRHARALGEELGRAARVAAPEPGAALTAVLEGAGFEPRRDGEGVVLVNCPFAALARAHPDLVCGMNLRLLDGVLSGVGDAGRSARLDPADGRCCVRLQ